VVVICPNCKVKLKVADEKIAPEGTRFKCPKCSTVLLVRKPVARVRPLNQNTVLASHEDPSVVERVRATLTAHGYKVLTAPDGIAAMVNATKELPFLAVLGVSIPKIYGFEVCRRLKSRAETREIKVILIGSTYDQNKYRRQPASFHGADGYIEDHEIETLLIGKIDALKELPKGTQAPSSAAEKPLEEAAKKTAMPQAGEDLAGRIAAEKKQDLPLGQPQLLGAGDVVEKAKRLARTILSDIYLYGKAKVDEAVRNNTFRSTFAPELREGLKLYEHRVSAGVRASGDFFNEAVNNFIEKRRKEIGQ
jgi:predicted Zn finger-like uncharacterized protein